MKRTILFLIIILMPMTYTLTLAQELTAEVTSKKAKIYKSPDVQDKALRTVSKGVRLTIKKSENGWCLCAFDGKEGWIQDKDIKFLSNDDIKIPPKPEEIDMQKQKVESKDVPKIEKEKEVIEAPPSYLKPMVVGIRLGINLAKLSGNDSDIKFGGDLSNRTGFCVGGLLSMNFNDYFSLQPELLYSQKGAVRGDSTVKLDYLELPLLLRVSIPLGDVKPFITVGPYVSYNFNHALKTKDSTYIYQDIKAFDYGLSLGGGLNFNFGRNELFLDVRYIMGLTTIHDATQNVLDLKNNILNFTIGIAF